MIRTHEGVVNAIAGILGHLPEPYLTDDSSLLNLIKSIRSRYGQPLEIAVWGEGAQVGFVKEEHTTTFIPYRRNDLNIALCVAFLRLNNLEVDVDALCKQK